MPMVPRVKHVAHNHKAETNKQMQYLHIYRHMCRFEFRRSTSYFPFYMFQQRVEHLRRENDNNHVCVCVNKQIQKSIQVTYVCSRYLSNATEKQMRQHEKEQKIICGAPRGDIRIHSANKLLYSLLILLPSPLFFCLVFFPFVVVVFTHVRFFGHRCCCCCGRFMAVCQ